MNSTYLACTLHDRKASSSLKSTIKEVTMLVRVHRQPLFDFPFETGIDRQFDSLFNGVLDGTERVLRRPRVNLNEDENQYMILAELPGVEKEELKISVHDDQLTIAGERKEIALPEDGAWLRNEIHVGNFSRTVAFPGEVNVDAIAAELRDGILTITLPKAEAARAREIKVS